MKKCVRWFLLMGILFCLLGTGIITAGLMKGGARNARSYVNDYYDHAEKIEHHLEDYMDHEL